ncbi:MAG: methionyl-tRNA formyltransferase [Crocinitomicaceae bacterium]
MGEKIVFMGTPEFAVESLKNLLDCGMNVAAVVTAPDRPAGRGRKIQLSAVKEYALSKGIVVLQPERLKNEQFLQDLKAIQADLFVVVAFRMLPEVVWQMPPKGTINLHGSLLPDYRGAAPINWAVINGETKTGATTFFIEKEIDTGKIIDKVSIDIGKNETAGELHDRLMVAGAKLLSESVEKVLDGSVTPVDQNKLMQGTLKAAPKIFKPDCKINWNNSAQEIHNKIRGLSPYPTAWTEISKDGQLKSLKLFTSRFHPSHQNSNGQLKVEDERLFIGANDGWVEILTLQLEGKKKMNTSDFLKGFPITEWKINP